ncbi:SDR family NAD(P)-dependent oxidoreductase [Sorangium sp. So ce1036]|uniref:SDR family NAD(P)-dependent oxidoreductase n=1 Tax=Sorangium sp. So ce1036 TaxID=3133328 RepID=UPI003EFF2C56
MQQLNGKTVLITGAASGIGLAMARRFAAEKAKIVLVDIEESALRNAEKELRAAGAVVLAARADVSKASEIEAAFARARAELGLVHVLCNNAGVGGAVGPTWAQSQADWDWTFAVNLWGVVNGTRIFLPPLLESGEEGHIVNTASMSGLFSTPFFAPYNASKHAVVAMSEVLAQELQLLGARVGVSLLCPGLVNTQIAVSERNRPAELRNKPDPARDGISQSLQQLALQQAAQIGMPPEEVAEAVLRAVLESRFYVLTHPSMKPTIEQRMRDILEERSPQVDPTFAAFASMFQLPTR